MSRVFNTLDREQADMYRWIRNFMTPSMFLSLTGKRLDSVAGLDVDRALREAFQANRVATTTEDLKERSKVRSGVLPQDLGTALLVYTKAAIERANGKAESDQELTKAFMDLCEEMAKLR